MDLGDYDSWIAIVSFFCRYVLPTLSFYRTHIYTIIFMFQHMVLEAINEMGHRQNIILTWQSVIRPFTMNCMIRMSKD